MEVDLRNVAFEGATGNASPRTQGAFAAVTANAKQAGQAVRCLYAAEVDVARGRAWCLAYSGEAGLRAQEAGRAVALAGATRARNGFPGRRASPLLGAVVANDALAGKYAGPPLNHACAGRTGLAGTVAGKTTATCVGALANCTDTGAGRDRASVRTVTAARFGFRASKPQKARHKGRGTKGTHARHHRISLAPRVPHACAFGPRRIAEAPRRCYLLGCALGAAKIKLHFN